MISDSRLRKISLAIALIGIALIFATASLSEPQRIAIADITDRDSGRIVSITGTISSYNTKDGHVFLTVTDGTWNMTVVMFERTARSYPDVYQLKKYDNVTVKGQINIYKSELEIIANTVAKVETGG